MYYEISGWKNGTGHGDLPVYGEAEASTEISTMHVSARANPRAPRFRFSSSLNVFCKHVGHTFFYDFPRHSVGVLQGLGGGFRSMISLLLIKGHLTRRTSALDRRCDISLVFWREEFVCGVFRRERSDYLWAVQPPHCTNGGGQCVITGAKHGKLNIDLRDISLWTQTQGASQSSTPFNPSSSRPLSISLIKLSTNPHGEMDASVVDRLMTTTFLKIVGCVRRFAQVVVDGQTGRRGRSEWNKYN